MPPGQHTDTGGRCRFGCRDLPYYCDESLLYALFASTQAVVSVKIIRNKVTNLSEGYGFVEFRTHEAAEQVRHLPGPTVSRPILRGFSAARAGVITLASGAPAICVMKCTIYCFAHAATRCTEAIGRAFSCHGALRRCSTLTTGVQSQTQTRSSGSTGQPLASGKAAPTVRADTPHHQPRLCQHPGIQGPPPPAAANLPPVGSGR